MLKNNTDHNKCTSVSFFHQKEKGKWFMASISPIYKTQLKCYNTLEVCFVESLPAQGDLCDVNVRSEIHSYDRWDCHVQACAAGREE